MDFDFFLQKLDFENLIRANYKLTDRSLDNLDLHFTALHIPSYTITFTHILISLLVPETPNEVFNSFISSSFIFTSLS